MKYIHDLKSHIVQHKHIWEDKTALAIFVLFTMAGVLSGFALAPKEVVSETKDVEQNENIIREGNMVGAKNKEDFGDTATGKLVKGGIDGEGTHHLDREGGDDQNVYLISSVVNLDEFVGKNVTVWGETFQGETAGWLMDVGIIELQ